MLRSRVAVRNRSVQIDGRISHVRQAYFRPLRSRRPGFRQRHAVLACAAPTLASAQIPYLQMNSAEPKYAAIVIDANSGEMLYDKRADSPRYPASVTKVMTLYLTFEALSEGRLKLTDRVPITPRAAAQADQAGPARRRQRQRRRSHPRHDRQVGQRHRRGHGRKAGRQRSRAFAALMTLRGQELGMRNSRFVNASGLPDSRQISTARDLAILSRATMRDFPQYYSYFSIKGFEFRGR